jgi:hypothetical protein
MNNFVNRKLPPDVYTGLQNEDARHIEGCLKWFNTPAKLHGLLDAGNTPQEIDRMWSDLIAACIAKKVKLPENVQAIAKRLGFTI